MIIIVTVQLHLLLSGDVHLNPGPSSIPNNVLDIPCLEAVWVETKLSQETILIGSFYRPPSSRVSYWKLINESIRNVANTSHKFFILGDFINDFLKNPSTHLLDILQFNNLSELVTSPTRFTNTSSTCNYLIITSSNYTVLNTEV